MHYVDASALVKRYARETRSTWVRRIMGSGQVATSRLSEMEVASGLARRAREGALSDADRDRAMAALVADLDAIVIVELVPDVTGRARAMLQRHPLRPGDAIQLASCNFLADAIGAPMAFVAFDDRLRRAAVAEGLRVLP